MKNLNSRYPVGDTLIEVIFAFAILGTIVGFAFTGAIAARKSSVSAQQRTQALLIAQYQSQALKTYRNSLPWDASGGFPNFMGDNGSVSGGAKINEISKYCMKPNSSTNIIWELISLTNVSNCNDLAPYLLSSSNGLDYIVQIKFEKPDNPSSSCKTSDIQTCDSVKANIIVQWKDRNDNLESVKNIVILTKTL